MMGRRPEGQDELGGEGISTRAEMVEGLVRLSIGTRGG